MSITHISSQLRREIIERAGTRCEYCLLPAHVAFFPHEIDHVVAESMAARRKLIIWPTLAGGVTGTKGLILDPSTPKQIASAFYSILAPKRGQNTLSLMGNT